ncbi:MAG: glycosyltransferase family 1 protein [Myxococcales bacterium]|nr:glycosyltransferase family 1 protein [Myxococcales bacterium]MCB9731138.1 glycosyltransferase family 1 protein [Deltaproteobacteria bacterium]
MRALLSTIGSRGDVQPLLALAQALVALGHDVHLCVPPDFVPLAASLGLAATPIGPELRATGKAPVAGAAPPTAAERRKLTEDTVAAQFDTLLPLARDADVVVGATALQVAAPSVAEKLGLPYVFAVYAPMVLPSPHHAPPVYALLGDAADPPRETWPALWEQNLARFDAAFGAALNAQRAALGLAPVASVSRHVFTARPLLAADPTLAPWPEPGDPGVAQTGAWLVRDARPLDLELEAFLAAGEAPVYFGFGSIRAPEGLARTMLAAARAHGRRAIVLRGWAELDPGDDGADVLTVGEVDQQALFRRVAAVVHHGGAGTTHVAALAGAPQVVIPQHYDQPYYAGRVAALGAGVAHPAGAPTVESLTDALGRALAPEVAERARALAEKIVTDGADVAARVILAATREAERPTS